MLQIHKFFYEKLTTDTDLYRKPTTAVNNLESHGLCFSFNIVIFNPSDLKLMDGSVAKTLL